MINIIVFSKDRSAQLELFIRSMKKYFKEFYQYKINILYTYSNDDFCKGYEKVFEIHNDSNINYIKEKSNFKNDVIELLNGSNPHTVFFVDDIVFKESFSITDIKFKLFSLNDDILTLSLRLHPKLTYCYPAKHRMKSPKFDSNLSFKWRGESGDYGYPMSLDGHFFRTEEFTALTKAITFNNPNSYESMLARYTFNRPKMICFEKSPIINNPINKVQVFNKNVHGDITAEFLNEKFLDDYIIDLYDFDGFENYSCHQEVGVNLIKNKK